MPDPTPTYPCPHCGKSILPSILTVRAAILDTIFTKISVLSNSFRAQAEFAGATSNEKVRLDREGASKALDIFREELHSHFSSTHLPPPPTNKEPEKGKVPYP